MRIDILTLFPEMFDGPLTQSIMKRAMDKGLVEMKFHDIRDYTLDKHKKVDDYAFGGGAGMVMTIQPIADLIDKLKSEHTYDQIIYMTPDGQRFDQRIANTLSLAQNIIIICGHYKGIDQRIRDMYVTQEISIGDFVLTGGELAAAVVSDAIIRLIPGVMSDETSALTDSFQDGLLSPPVYTRPADYKGRKVPEVLLSGNQAKIDQWREEQAYDRTKQLRPDLLDE
ncbi:tRNA (guanosine(37)-N1)-methyltransferase TrmD [Carboxylicivirga sp. N1Y90]|uniref:tRNA (guanosine(37)-N1)-methyltransferase TrmD n=1 Tax=Carboxylicivirga fragile TaxID=3417571 RepID=UPI003D332E53|nr:tRNA (guanosine(37)-N1)-methyltransferase TrmD [Marinilabiliaceae bacterium N1Y90]